MITLILVRHGQSIGNLLDLYCGQTDYDLSEKGELHAKLTAAYLKEHYSIDKIYASDLTRAYRTAEETARLFDLPIQKVPAMRELSAGCWEGQNAGDIIVNNFELYNQWRSGGDVCPEGAETHKQLRQRVHAFLDQVLEQDDGKTVAIFSHWCPIHRAVHRLWDQSPDTTGRLTDVMLPNGSVTVLLVDPKTHRLEIKLLGYQEHLGEHKTVFNDKTV